MEQAITALYASLACGMDEAVAVIEIAEEFGVSARELRDATAARLPLAA